MNSSRRKFITTSAIAVAGSAILPNYLFAGSRKIERLGLQLYSVRDAMKVDPKGSLKKLADMGYLHVEHANYIDRKFYGYSAKDFKKLLNDLELLMPSGHVRLQVEDWDTAKGDFTDKWKYTVEDAAAVGQRYLMNAWIEENVRADVDGLKRYIEKFNKCGELCKAQGITFGYHNHNFEFTLKIGDDRLYDYILKNTDPNLVTQQLDIGNVPGEGAEVLELLKKYPGRFELLHVKDKIKSNAEGNMDGYVNTVLGVGVMPVKEIVNTARKIGGTSQFIIEQEEYQGKDAFDCVKIDLQMMKKWGY